MNETVFTREELKEFFLKYSGFYLSDLEEDDTGQFIYFDFHHNGIHATKLIRIINTVNLVRVDYSGNSVDMLYKANGEVFTERFNGKKREEFQTELKTKMETILNDFKTFVFDKLTSNEMRIRTVTCQKKLFCFGEKIKMPFENKK